MNNTKKAEYTKTPLQPMDQYNSIAAKMKPEWYYRNANYWIDICMSNSDKGYLRKFFNAANGLVDQRTYEYVLKTYIDESGESKNQYGELRDIDFLTPIKEKSMGEFTTAARDIQVYNNDPSTVLARNKAQGDKIMGWIQQEIINRLNQAGMDTGQPTIEQDELEDMVDKFLADWTDDVTVKANHRLKLVHAINNAAKTYEDCFFNFWATEECYDYCEIVDGEVIIKAIDPLEYYRLDSGNIMVEDDDAGCRRYQMSIPQVIDQHRHRLDKEQIDYLQWIYTGRYGYDPNEGMQWIRRMEDFAERKFEDRAFSDLIVKEFNDVRDKIWVYHYVFKTRIKVGILTYADAFGVPQEREVDETYKLDKSKGDISIEWEWINQVWQGWRFGDRAGGVYTKPEPVPFQRELVNNTSVCKLPYNGIVGLSKNNIRNPIPYRILPYLALYRIYTLQIERATAKFKSWMFIPESIMSDSDVLTAEQRMAFAEKDGIYNFDDTLVSANALQGVREVATKAWIDYIRVMNELCDKLKQDAFEEAHYNNARAGETKDYGGKAVAEYNLNQGLTGSAWLIQTFMHFYSKSCLRNVDATKIAWIEGKQGSYIDPQTGNVEFVDLDGSTDSCSNLGIFFRNNAEMQEMLNQIKEFGFNLGQNGEAEAALEAITNTSIQVIKKNIKKSIEATRKYNQEMETMRAQAEQELEQTRQEAAREARDFEAEQKELDRQNILEAKRIEGEYKLQLERERWNIDLNRNGNIDKDEAAVALGGASKAQIEQVKLNQALRK